MKWYLAHTYSGMEDRALLSLQDQIKRTKMQELFGEIFIPTEEELEHALNRGPQGSRGPKFYPGCLIFQMELTERSRDLVKNTPKITGFHGGGFPLPLKEPIYRTRKSS